MFRLAFHFLLTTWDPGKERFLFKSERAPSVLLFLSVYRLRPRLWWSLFCMLRFEREVPWRLRSVSIDMQSAVYPVTTPARTPRPSTCLSVFLFCFPKASGVPSPKRFLANSLLLPLFMSYKHSHRGCLSAVSLSVHLPSDLSMTLRLLICLSNALFPSLSLSGSLCLSTPVFLSFCLSLSVSLCLSVC